MILKHLKYLLFILLTFLLGTQTTYAKTKLVLPQTQVSFSIEQTQNFKSLEKDVPPNIGFLKEETIIEGSERLSAHNQPNLSECFNEYVVTGLRKQDITLKNLKNTPNPRQASIGLINKDINYLRIGHEQKLKALLSKIETGSDPILSSVYANPNSKSFLIELLEFEKEHCIKLGKFSVANRIDNVLVSLANAVAKHPNWVEITSITSKVDGLTPHVLKVETKIDGSFFPKNKTISGQSFQMEGFKGCHSENALKEYVQANGGTYSVKNKSLGQGGVYEGQPVINLNNKEYVKINGRFVEYEPGKLGGTSSFFPENWSNAKIKQEVEFALTNNHGKVNPLDPVDRLHFGFSSDGAVEIQFYLNSDGSIGSYFPKKR